MKKVRIMAISRWVRNVYLSDNNFTGFVLKTPVELLCLFALPSALNNFHWQLRLLFKIKTVLVRYSNALRFTSIDMKNDSTDTDRQTSLYRSGTGWHWCRLQTGLIKTQLCLIFDVQKIEAITRMSGWTATTHSPLLNTMTVDIIPTLVIKHDL